MLDKHRQINSGELVQFKKNILQIANITRQKPPSVSQSISCDSYNKSGLYKYE